MIDRLNFAKSINHDNFERNIIHFFDQTMALYNLIGARDDLDISANGNVEEKTIEFILLSDNNKEAKELYSLIEGHNIPIYGHNYLPELRNVKNTVHIALVDIQNTIEPT